MKPFNLIANVIIALCSIGIVDSCTKSTASNAAIDPRPDTVVNIPPEPKHIRYEIRGRGFGDGEVRYTPHPHAVSVSLPWSHSVTLADTSHTVQITLADFRSWFDEDIQVRIFLNNQKIKDTTLHTQFSRTFTATVTCNF